MITVFQQWWDEVVGGTPNAVRGCSFQIKLNFVLFFFLIFFKEYKTVVFFSFIFHSYLAKLEVGDAVLFSQTFI